MKGESATEEAVRAAVETYRAGANRRTTCAKHGISPERLRDALKAAGVEVRPRWPKKPETVVKGSGDGVDTVASTSAYRVVRIADGVVLSGGANRKTCERQCICINTYARIAEVRP